MEGRKHSYNFSQGSKVERSEINKNGKCKKSFYVLNRHRATFLFVKGGKNMKKEKRFILTKDNFTDVFSFLVASHKKAVQSSEKNGIGRVLSLQKAVDSIIRSIELKGYNSSVVCLPILKEHGFCLSSSFILYTRGQLDEDFYLEFSLSSMARRHAEEVNGTALMQCI